MLLPAFARLRQFSNRPKVHMRADRVNNPLKVLIIALCLGFSTGVRAASDAPLLYAECKQQMLSLAETLWTPDQVSARTLDGKFQLTLRLGYRLRSYFEASNGLATKLALSAPGLRFLILFGMEGPNEKLRADLDATLSAEEKRELDALTPLLRVDTVFLTLVNQLYTAGNQVFEHSSPWREIMMGDPLFVPLLATFCGAVCETQTKRIIDDFASRYVNADQIEISKQMLLALRQDDRLRLYLASLYSDVPFSMEGLTFPKNRIVLNAPEFIQALAGSAGYESLNDLNRILIAAWQDRTGHLSLTLPSGESLPFWRYATTPPGVEFTLALTHIVKGQDAQARKAL